MSTFDGRLSPAHWLADATEPIDHPAYLALAVAQTLAFAGAVFGRMLAEPLLGGQPAAMHTASRVAAAVGALAAIGLVLLLLRWLAVPVFSKRLWLALWWGAAVVAAIWAARAYVRHRRTAAAP